MSRLLGASALAVAFLLSPPFKPVELVSAADVPYPWASVADGVVVLQVATDQTGRVTGTSALRDIASLTAPAAAAVRSWKFRPASRADGPAASAMTVAVAFRPAAGPAAAPIFAAVHPEPESGYAPAGIRAAGYPEYPWNVVAPGTVVLQVAVDEAGRAGAIETIRGIVPLTGYAMRAARAWRFEAASLNGKPVPSKVAIAFVFRLPVTGP